MKKLFIILTIFFVNITYLPSKIYSQGTVNFQIPNPSKYNSMEEIINAASSLIQPFFILTFAAMILVGAGMYMTSRGDEEKITKGKQTIIASIIGFCIAVFAPSVANFIMNLIGVSGFNF